MAKTHTLFVWNDERIVIRYAASEEDALDLAGEWRELLHKDHDDPRWQFVEGLLEVNESVWPAHINATKRHSLPEASDDTN